MEDIIDTYTEDTLQVWEETGTLAPWEAGFIRGTWESEEEEDFTDDEEEEEIMYENQWQK